MIAARGHERERPDVGVEALDVGVAVVEAIVLLAPVQRGQAAEQREREVGQDRVADRRADPRRR